MQRAVPLERAGENFDPGAGRARKTGGFMKRIVLLVFSLMLAFGATGALAAETVNVNGSTTVLPIMQKMVEAFMKKKPGVSITVSGGGSGNGIKALLDGSTDIAMASREMKASENKLAQEKKLEPKPLAIAIDAIIPIVHPANQVAKLTKAELRAIYAGTVKNWKEVGGEDKGIVVISRDSSSGTYEAWNELIMGGEKVTPRALLSASSGAMLQTVAKNRHAIGYDSYGYLNKTVKAVSVDGVQGSPETAANGTYPVSRKLWIITAGEPKGAAAEFVAFIMGPEGQKIVSQSGAVPVK